MPTRSARTTWNGGFETGSGQVDLTSSGLGTFDVSFPKRAADDGGDITNPEELLAASHTACFAMQFSHELEALGGTPKAFRVTSEVSLGADPEGGFKLTGIALTVRGSADGVDNAAFVAAAEAARTGCPISKALTGVTITLDAALEG